MGNDCCKGKRSEVNMEYKKEMNAATATGTPDESSTAHSTPSKPNK